MCTVSVSISACGQPFRLFDAPMPSQCQRCIDAGSRKPHGDQCNESDKGYLSTQGAKRKEKKRHKREGFLSRVRPNAFYQKKLKTKSAPKLPTHQENTEKQLFDIGLCHGFVWAFFLGGWAAASDPDTSKAHDQVCPWPASECGLSMTVP